MQLPFFYGWVIVAIVMIAGVLAAGVSNITMAVVLKPISEDLGWSRTLMAAAITIGSLSGGLLRRCSGRWLIVSGRVCYCRWAVRWSDCSPLA